MATISRTSLGDLLKELYDSGDIEMLVNLTHPALEELAPKGSAAIGGQDFFFPVRTESAHGHAYIAEGQALPAGRQSTVKQARVAPTTHAGVVQLTGLSMSISSGNAMAFGRAFEENVSQTIKAMTAYKEGTLFRDGSGVLTLFDGNPGTGTTASVDEPECLREGMVVDMLDATSTTRHDTNMKIQKVNWATKVVTFTTSLADANPDDGRIFLADTQADSGQLNTAPEPLGFEASIRATNTYLGLARTGSGNANWGAHEMAVSAFLDESVLGRARTRITQDSGIDIGGMAGSFKLACHPMQADVLFKLAIPRIDFSPGQAALGFSSNPSYGDIKLVTSYQCPPARAYLGDFSKHQSLYTPGGELHVDTEFNGSALKWVANYDTGIVFLKEYSQFVLRNPSCFLRLSALTELTR